MESAFISEAVQSFLSGVVFPVLAAFFSALASWAVYKLGKKYNLDVLIKNEALVQQAVLRGIGYAEEFAARKLREGNVKITGKAKLDMAIAQVMKAVPSIGREQAEDYVHALLPQLQGAGATKEMTL